MVGGEGGDGADLAGGGGNKLDEMCGAHVRRDGADAVDGVELPGEAGGVLLIGQELGQFGQGEGAGVGVVVVAGALGARLEDHPGGREGRGVGLEGLVVMDPKGAGVRGVVEVDGPRVAGALGIVQDQAARLTAGLGYEEVEFVDGHLHILFHVYCQWLVNSSIYHHAPLHPHLLTLRRRLAPRGGSVLLTTCTAPTRFVVPRCTLSGAEAVLGISARVTWTRRVRRVREAQKRPASIRATPAGARNPMVLGELSRAYL